MAHLGGAIRGYSNSEPNDKMSSRPEFIQADYDSHSGVPLGETRLLGSL
jgi:hypothetical protein